MTSSTAAATTASVARGGPIITDDSGSVASKSLASRLDVSLSSLERLFRADTQQDFEQPVWMVVNLQVGCMQQGAKRWIIVDSSRG